MPASVAPSGIRSYRRTSRRASSSTSVGIAGLRQLLVQLLHFAGAAVAFAKLTLDGRHLFAQHRLALALVEGRPGLLSDLMGQPKHFETLGQEFRHFVDARSQVDGLEQLLLFVRA